MILQPMVENAVRRGLACYSAGRIHISAKRIGTNGERLELRVADVGIGPSAPPRVPLAPPTASAWVANARARLIELHGSKASLELSATMTRLTVPWHEAEDEPVATAAPERPADDGSRLPASIIGRWRPLVLPAVILLVLSVPSTFAHLEKRLPDGTTYPVPLEQAIPAGIIAAGIMVAIGLVAFRVTRRYPPVPLADEQTSRGRLFAAHAKAAITLGFVGAVLRAGTSWFFGHLFQSVDQIRVVKAVNLTIGTTALYALLYVMLAVVAYGVEYARRYRQARETARRLREELEDSGRRRTSAELRALKAELNPHFLGNALHTVSGLLRTDPEAAGRVLAQLGELLQAAVTRSRTHEVTLREELETLEPYLAVEQARLGQRLDVRWDVDETVLNAHVPHMILQPLVENAVKHGLAPRQSAGHIEVAARRGTDCLELSIRDDGVGLENGGGFARPTGHHGVGLANTRARLAELYGAGARLELTPAEAGGAVARLSLPWRDAAMPGLVTPEL
jgi:two-component sensor histidine kinase